MQEQHCELQFCAVLGDRIYLTPCPELSLMRFVSRGSEIVASWNMCVWLATQCGPKRAKDTLGLSADERGAAFSEAKPLPY